MKLKKIKESLNLEVIAGYSEEDKEVEGAYIGDLLSVVMSSANENNIWITIQTHLNIIAVATLVGTSCIIVAEGMEIDEETIKKANEINMPLFRSNLSSYEIACKLNELGI
ncbi:DRTGG domain-containing protein [Sporanaerobacter acetigenes]|uniref:DRTGG domain-containing protein n=1 Tax=Sporanaerobacter acetigenes DSM 13106 TaxID=1123281 RepID=A0A1M5UYU3_9FIRM|nr:DRTGG domain-containing protein [Sporanaerobacter acetigenes]SHH68018.1 DRTGG domain-containing protein [Sporanaerobacter acetigenes DSM 13106]